MALTDKLSAIGNAIRSKNGTTELMTLDEMPAAIEAIETGGGAVPAESLVLTDRCDYKFAFDGWTWFVEEYGNQITSENILSAYHMFESSTVSVVPFDINFEEREEGYSDQCGYMFCNSAVQEVTGTIRNAKPSYFNQVFAGCSRLKELPAFENLDLSYCQSNGYSATYANFIYDCWNLRSIPESLLKQLWHRAEGCGPFSLMRSMYKLCSIDTINKISPFAAYKESSNALGGFGDCFRLKSLTFDTELPDFSNVNFTLGWDDLSWSNQTLDLSYHLGWADYNLETLTNMIGGVFVASNQVSDDSSYQQLKDTQDWWTLNSDYSRYNRISAVETINSLPTTNGSGNVIKFLETAGRYTDGGRIGDMTEEEIAVATAKGWTVSFV